MTKNALSATELTELIAGLNRLARNLWWTWNQEAQEIFQELSPRGWQNLYHNAVAILHEVSEYELRVRLAGSRFRRARAPRAGGVRRLSERERTPGAASTRRRCIDNPVAYFTAEFGFHETLPIAAGGLGILAGDHAKSASDLGLGFVGISLFYREGYFQQAIEPGQLADRLLHAAESEKSARSSRCSTRRANRWSARSRSAMSDVVVPGLARQRRPRAGLSARHEPARRTSSTYRDLTLRVYGGDSTTRIMQEILLGIGGVRLLRALGFSRRCST